MWVALFYQWFFITLQAIFYTLVWGLGCSFETSDWEHEGSRARRRLIASLLVVFGYLIIVFNILCSALIIKLIVADRTELSGIYDPLYKYSGCYEVPYVYLDEEALSTWPSASRKALAYIFICGIVQPVLIFSNGYLFNKMI